MSCRAGSVSASPSAEPCCLSPACYCSMNRWPRSMHHAVRKYCPTWKRCAINWPSRWCMSAIISTKCCGSRLILCSLKRGKTLAGGNLSEMSLHPRVRAIIGTDAVGAIVDGTVLGTDSSSGLTRVQVGQGELKVQFGTALPGTRLRVQLLARDLIVATEPPRHISVRNSLPGVITSVANDVDDSDLIAIDIGGILIMARVTKAATRELGLATGKPVWALVKSASLRPHVI